MSPVASPKARQFAENLWHALETRGMDTYGIALLFKAVAESKQGEGAVCLHEAIVEALEKGEGQ